MKHYNPTIIGNTVSDGSFTGTEFLGINSDTITTAVSITNATLTDAGYSQSGKVIRIANGANAINYTVNAGLTASFVKGGTGAITFVQGAGRTLTGVYGLVFDGAVGSTASISSFGTTDIVTISGNILNGEIRLPAYPSTRNDGVIPTNKVLSTDTNGNLKLYSIATAPAPFLDYVIPDSTLPSTTGNFQLYGSFFTPSMCLTANLATSIIFTGQTVNYAVFHNSNWIEVNITTGATEGSFAITLNNGLSATFTNAILIVLGTVTVPVESNYISIVGTPDITVNGEFKLLQANIFSRGVIDKTIWQTPNTADFQISFNWTHSPLYLINSSGGGFGSGDTNHYFELLDSTTNALITGFWLNQISVQYNRFYIYRVGQDGSAILTNFTDGSDSFIKSKKMSFKRIGGVLGLYINDSIIYSLVTQPTNAMYVRISTKVVDVKNIKLIIT